MISDVDMIFRLQELSTKLTGSLTYKTGSMEQTRAAGIVATFKAILNVITGAADLGLCSILSGIDEPHENCHENNRDRKRSRE